MNNLESPNQYSEQKQAFSKTRFRTTFLGAAAIVAIGGLGAETTLMSIHPVHAAQIAAEPAPGQIAPGSFADVVARVSPAVLSVKVKIAADSAIASQDDEGDQQHALPNIPKGDPRFKFFQQFGEGEGVPHQRPHASMAQGSGFFISKDGYVVTDNHVVEHVSVNGEAVTGATRPVASHRGLGSGQDGRSDRLARWRRRYNQPNAWQLAG